jgi:polypeptide N-acetylgalactosaminyltransferase
MQGNQHFQYRIDTEQLYNPISNQCLDCDTESGEIFMEPCSDTAETQKWHWEHLDRKLIGERNMKSGHR